MAAPVPLRVCGNWTFDRTDETRTATPEVESLRTVAARALRG
jgi:hypothetical protein